MSQHTEGIIDALKGLPCEKPVKLHASPECLIHGCNCTPEIGGCDSEEVGHTANGRVDDMCLPCRALYFAYRLDSTLDEMEVMP